MTALKIDQFRGIYPRIPAHLLPQAAATISQWADHARGELRPMKGGAPYRVVTNNLKSAYLPWDGAPPVSSNPLLTAKEIYSWERDVDILTTPGFGGSFHFFEPATDPLLFDGGLYYGYTGDSIVQPQGGEPATKLRLGLPDPPSPTITLDATPAPGPGVVTRAYVTTFSNGTAESKPSMPVTISAIPGTTVVTITSTTFVAPFFNDPPNAVNVYRSQDGGAADEYYFVKSIPIPSPRPATVSTTDDVTLVGFALDTYDNDPPPANVMGGMLRLDDELYVAWSRDTLYFNRRGKLYAWPQDNRITLSYVIKGAIQHGNGLLVLTTHKPFYVTGSDFESLNWEALDIPHAGVSKWAVANLAGVTAYASPEGIVMVNGMSGTLSMSERFFSRDVWFARYGAHLATMQFVYHGQSLIVFSRTGAFTPFLIHLGEPEPYMTELPDLDMRGVIRSNFNNALYYFIGNELRQFEGGTEMPMVWQSREIVLAKPENFGIAAARCTGSFLVDFYADGVLRHTQAVTGETTFRLPSGFVAQRWQIRVRAVSAGGVFRDLRIADTGRALAEV